MHAKKIRKAKASTPSVRRLILKAVSDSKKHNGVSLFALKKALAAAGYDVEKNKAQVKIAIKNLVNNGTLVQTKGFGASATFRINQEVVKSKVKHPRTKKAVRKVRKRVVKKPAKKAAAKKRAGAAKSPKKAMKTRAAKRAVKIGVARGLAKKATGKKAAKPKSRKAESNTRRR